MAATSVRRGLRWIAYVLVGCLCLSAISRLAGALLGLIWALGGLGAKDLDLRYQEVQFWFEGRHVYALLDIAVYPPATYAMLWPFLGWTRLEAARFLWAITTVLMVIWLSYMLVRQSKADNRLWRFAVGVTPFAIYATAATIRVGQMGIHVLTALLAGILFLHGSRVSWRRDLLAAVLLLFALAKPTISVPLILVAFLAPGGLRVAGLVALGYVALTFFAASFQPGNAGSLVFEWLGQRPQHGLEEGYASVHAWLIDAGNSAWLAPASLAILLGFSVWLYRRRYVDLWILIGVAALVSRFWAYHRYYDDLLVLFPLISLLRVVRHDSSARILKSAAAVLLACGWCLSIIPTRLIWNAHTHAYVQWSQTVIWLAMLAFLLLAGVKGYGTGKVPSTVTSSPPEASGSASRRRSGPSE